MENKNLELQLQEINRKLDVLTEHMAEQQRRSRELQELKDDLSRIGKDVFQAATEELDEVAQHFELEDLLFLLKKLLRNTRHLAAMMDQVESASDFIKDAEPLGKQVFNQLMETLAELERKGYFEFAREFFKIIDTVVTTFTVEDVRLFRENIASILLTVKNLTQPEMLSTFDNALGFFRKMDVVVEKEVSYWQLIKELRDPETKRGLDFLIQFLKNLVNKNGTQITVEPT
ncbi:MAG: hypothetical protein Kow0042_10700 [Calditrichia bacterium]